jgi:beta-lactamase class A
MGKKIITLFFIFILILGIIFFFNLESINTYFFTTSLKHFIENNVPNSDHISVYIYKFNTKQEIKINDNYQYMPASLMKLPCMITYYKGVEADPRLLQKIVIYQSSMEKPLTQNIHPYKTLLSGEKYTINDLIDRMIIYSDNNASNLLLDHLNPNNLNHTFSDIGIAPPNFSNIKYTISASDFGKFFIELYNESYLNKAMSQKALVLLEKSDYKGGLVAGVPKNILVAHKFGERRMKGAKMVNQFHDCGIVYVPHDPYVLCVMTDGNDIYKQAGLVKNISRFVYQNNVNTFLTGPFFFQ